MIKRVNISNIDLGLGGSSPSIRKEIEGMCDSYLENGDDDVTLRSEKKKVNYLSIYSFLKKVSLKNNKAAK